MMSTFFTVFLATALVAVATVAADLSAVPMGAAAKEALRAAAETAEHTVNLKTPKNAPSVIGELTEQDIRKERLKHNVESHLVDSVTEAAISTAHKNALLTGIEDLGRKMEAARLHDTNAKIAQTETHRSTWALIEVDSAGRTTLVATRKSEQHVDPCVAFPRHHGNHAHHGHHRHEHHGHTHGHGDHGGRGHIVVSYRHPDPSAAKHGGGVCHVPRKDPRLMHHDTMETHEEMTARGAETPAFKGGVKKHDKITFAVSLHPEVNSFDVVDLVTGTHTLATHSVTAQHFMHPLALATVDRTKVKNYTIQQAGDVATQHNLVFLSSGYLASDEGTFNADVERLTEFMRESTDTLSSMPFRRYFPTMNLYRVFYPSNQAGAAMPAPAGNGYAPDDNLGCSYGELQQRILQCDRTKVQLLGSYAPPPAARAVYVVLVNDKSHFGGTGGSGICNIYTGSKMTTVFIHEMGHADADVADEYNYGTDESKQVQLTNCYWSDVNPPWQKWIDANIMPKASPVCTYGNYYKPTPGTCIMESENRRFCPVCAEKYANKLFGNQMNLANPMFPSMFETVMIENGKTGELWINRAIPTHKDVAGDFTVEWTFNGQVVGGRTHMIKFAPMTATLTGSMARYSGPGSYTVQVAITDHTNMYLQAEREAHPRATNFTTTRQVVTFRIQVYATGAAVQCTQRNITNIGYSYCAVCDAGKEEICALDFKAVALETKFSLDGALAKLEGWMVGLGAVFMVLGLIALALIWRSMSLYASAKVMEVMPLTKWIKVLRIVLLVLQCILLVIATLGIIFCAYMYTVLSVFGRAIVIGIIVVACVIWFASFVGFCATWYKNRMVLYAYFALMLALLCCGFIFSFLLIYAFVNVEDPDIIKQLHSEWKDAVNDNPKNVCGLQHFLECSGYNTSCVTITSLGGSSDCPRSCEESNRNGFPCLRRIQEFVKEKFPLAAAAGLALSALVGMCMGLGLGLGCNIKTQRADTWKSRRERYNRGETALTDEEITMLRDEFNKIDKDGSGDISRQEFSTFYNEVMGAKLNPRQLEEYFDKLDLDHSGALSFDEFVRVYVPPKKQQRKSIYMAESGTFGDTFPEDQDSHSPAHSVVINDGPESSDESNHTEEVGFTGTGLSQTGLSGTGLSGTGGELQACATMASQKPDQEPEMDLVLDESDGADDAFGPDVLSGSVDLASGDLASGGSKGPAQAAKVTAAEQEERAREATLAMAKSQAYADQSALDQKPSGVGMDHMLDDLALDIGGDEDNFEDFENMDLEIDLDGPPPEF